MLIISKAIICKHLFFSGAPGLIPITHFIKDTCSIIVVYSVYL